MAEQLKNSAIVMLSETKHLSSKEILHFVQNDKGIGPSKTFAQSSTLNPKHA